MITQRVKAVRADLDIVRNTFTFTCLTLSSDVFTYIQGNQVKSLFSKCGFEMG